MTGILNKVGSFIHNNLNFDNSNNDFGSYTDPYLDVNSDIWNSGQTEPHNLSSNLTSALEPINYNRLSQYDELATSHAYPRTSNHAVSHTAHPAVPQVSSHILSRAASHTTPYEGAHAAQQAPPAASEYSGDNNQHINLDYLNNEFNYSNYLQPSASMMAQAGQMQSPRFLQNNNFHSNNFNNFFPQTPMNAPSKSPNAFDLGLPNVDVPIANKPTAFLRTPPSDSDATIENKKVNATSTQIKNVASRSRREKKQVPHMAHIECGITETVNEKTKKAKMVIEQQQLAVTEAGKMGQYATITYNNGGRAVIGGALWYAQGYDPTIPVTQDDEDALFTKMLAAISNNQNCSHSSTSNVFKNRWGNEAKYYTQIELEDAAWDIIQEIKKVHTDGWTYKIRDKHLRETIQETMFWSFQDRFDGVVELLRHSKTSCDALMKGERVYTIIGNPATLNVRVKVNKMSNDRKGEVLKNNKGDVAKTRKRALEVIEEEEGTTEERPRKRANNKRTRDVANEDEGATEERPVKRTRKAAVARKAPRKIQESSSEELTDTTAPSFTRRTDTSDSDFVL